MNVKLDDFDIRILNIVQHNNRYSAEQVAEMVGLSSSAVQRRLKRLRDERIILAEIAVLSPEAIGQKLTAVVAVTLEQEHPEVLDEFKNLMVVTPEVMQCYYVTGDVDFILIITVKDMQDYEAFTSRFLSANPNVRRFNTSVVINIVKLGLAFPLEASAPARA